MAVDLPGFGRSGKPGSLNYTIEEYDAFIERFLDWRGLERVRLVMHDWGGVGLAFAQRRPERVERMVLINLVPFLPGYRWHRTARIWRTPGLGELAMGVTVGFTLKWLSRESNVTPGPLPEDMRRSIIDHLDQGTQRAILRLYRSSPPERLAAAGAHLGDVSAPTLVAWGTRDPYIPERFGRELRRRLPARRAARAARRRPLALARPPRPAGAGARVPGPRMSGRSPMTGTASASRSRATAPEAARASAPARSRPRGRLARPPARPGC